MGFSALEDDVHSFRDLLRRCFEEIAAAHDREISAAPRVLQPPHGFSPRCSPPVGTPQPHSSAASDVDTHEANGTPRLFPARLSLRKGDCHDNVGEPKSKPDTFDRSITGRTSKITFEDVNTGKTPWITIHSADTERTSKTSDFEDTSTLGSHCRESSEHGGKAKSPNVSPKRNKENGKGTTTSRGGASSPIGKGTNSPIEPATSAISRTTSGSVDADVGTLSENLPRARSLTQVKTFSTTPFSPFSQPGKTFTPNKFANAKTHNAVLAATLGAKSEQIVGTYGYYKNFESFINGSHSLGKTCTGKSAGSASHCTTPQDMTTSFDLKGDETFGISGGSTTSMPILEAVIQDDPRQPHASEGWGTEGDSVDDRPPQPTGALSPKLNLKRSGTRAAGSDRVEGISGVNDPRNGGGNLTASMTALLQATMEKAGVNRGPSRKFGSAARGSLSSIEASTTMEGRLSGSRSSQGGGERLSFVSLPTLSIGVPSELPLLDKIMSIIILIDIVVVGVSYDYHPQWIGWVVITGMSAASFIIEMLVKCRLLGCRQMFRGQDSATNLLDVVLMIASVADLCALLYMGELTEDYLGLYLLRILRLGRIWKIARATWLPFASECQTMVISAAGAIRTLFWVLVLMVVPHYIFALILRASFGRFAEATEITGAEAFSNVGISFFNVFRCSVVGECTQLDGRPFPWLLVRYYGPFFALAYVVGVSLMEFGLFHVISATYVARVVETARQRDNERQQKRLSDIVRLTDLIQRLLLIIWELNEDLTADEDSFRILGEDLDHGAAIQEASKLEISCDFFEELLSVQSFHDVLTELDICYEDRNDLFDSLDVDSSGSLDMIELLVGITKLRGNPRRSDIVSNTLLTKQVQKEIREMAGVLQEFQEKIQKAMAEQDALLRHVCWDEQQSLDNAEGFTV